MNSVVVHINGEPRQVTEQNLFEFLKHLNITTTHLAVAINDRVIPSAEYTMTRLSEGDCVEIIRPVCGG